MKVALISDTHGIHMPPIAEDTEFIIHAGDIAPDSVFSGQSKEAAIAQQEAWFAKEFNIWRADNGDIPLYGTWGNHDFYGERIRNYNHNGCHLATNRTLEVGGLKTWFSPWVSPIGKEPRWAFEVPANANPWKDIPDDTQVLVTHGPLWGLGDLIIAAHTNWERYLNVGSKLLLERCLELQHLRLVVCGHIHEARGLYANDKVGAPIFNVAVLSERYTPVASPVVYIEWPTDDIRGEEGYGFGV